MSEVAKEEVQETAQEVATNSQTQTTEPSSEVGGLIAESKKYRSRAQDAETKLAELEKQLAKQEEDRMAKQNEWKELAEKRHYTSTNRWVPVNDIKNGYVTNSRHTTLISDAAALDLIVF